MPNNKKINPQPNMSSTTNQQTQQNRNLNTSPAQPGNPTQKKTTSGK